VAVRRLGVLDGWRGISILLVLLGHLFPVGPKAWALNNAVAGAGMAIFFTLSGFLITSVLLADANIRRFLIHRIMRIVPLAWLAMALTLALTRADAALWPPHLLFYANLFPRLLVEGTGHFWSLCVEMQFYMGVALIVGTMGRRALFMLPAIAVVVTLYRAGMHYTMDIRTDKRIDEILAGCTLALTWHHRPAWFAREWLAWLPLVLAPLLVASAHAALPWLNYLRPWIASTMVGCTLGGAAAHPVRRLLSTATLRYVAEISFALYVVHGCLVASWLDTGDKLVKYAKRPLFIAATWGLAHISTRWYEAFFIRLGKRWAGTRADRPA
jgi:peptidoglycan/LPS O-acetylase OafA/YrhL